MEPEKVLKRDLKRSSPSFSLKFLKWLPRHLKAFKHPDKPVERATYKLSKQIKKTVCDYTERYMAPDHRSLNRHGDQNCHSLEFPIFPESFKHIYTVVHDVHVQCVSICNTEKLTPRQSYCKIGNLPLNTRTKPYMVLCLL